MSKILILGAKGMLGQELVEVFKKEKPVCWDKNDLDITKRDIVLKKIKKLKPEIIINAVAYTAVDDCEKNRTLAMKVNAKAVGYLAEVAKNLEAILVHYSTDYIFDGKNKKGYQENDRPKNPVNTYGWSKLKGEELILKEVGPLSSKERCLLKYYLIRTSWLYGKGGRNFVDTILNLMKKNKIIRLVSDQFGKPTYTKDLAKATKKLLNSKNPWGIYHLTNETRSRGISWYDFACEIIKILNAKKVKIIPQSSSQLKRPAKRPKYSMLINTKLPLMRDWKEALREYMLPKFKNQKSKCKITI